ncbi:hypothetical protein GCM10009675_41500 [Prauserella alba]|uniref:Uncharacterized protein n=1 Tax=Prauserella alba TaxID=176898 RepID=A0ABP4G5X7_9PSEU
MAVGGHGDVHALRTEATAQRLAHTHFVVDDQHSRFHICQDAAFPARARDLSAPSQRGAPSQLGLSTGREDSTVSGNAGDWETGGYSGGEEDS